MKCAICNFDEATEGELCKTCDGNMKVMAEMDKAWQEEIEEQTKKDTEFLASINYLFSTRVKKFFDEEMEEIGGVGFTLVDTPKGDKQDYGAYIDYYVDQWSVGDSGDSFEGNCYLKLSNDKYLKWSYEC